MQAAVWGMDYFQEHLRGKRFILYTDHKPLEAFIDQSVLWKKISAQDSWDAQPRAVLFVPTKLRQQLICEAHGKLLTGHNGIQKTKERLLTSYFWPNMDFDISNHIKSCLQCQMKD